MKKFYLDIKFGKYQKAKGYILDIGLGGMGIALNKQIKRGTQLEISPRKWVFISLKAEVVSVLCRSKKGYPHRIGVKFISLEKHKTKALAGFINKIVKRRIVNLAS